MHRAVPGRRPVVVTTAALLALALAACDDGAAESTLDARAAWTEVTMPGSSQVAGPRETFTAALGRSGNLPALVAGSGGEPGEPASARAWTDSDDGDWRWQELLADGPESEVGFAVSDGSTTWIGGTTWQAGEPVSPYVVSSGDRQTWEVVELPGDAADRALRPGAAALVGGAPVVVGMDSADEPVALLLGADAELVSLPAAPGGREFHGFRGAATLGDTVVGVGSVAEPGRSAEAVVYRSTDGGASWTVTLGPAEGPADLSGVVATSGGFVVTGYLWGGDGVATPAAWSSADGAAWTAEALPTLDQDRDGLSVAPGDHSWLDVPAVSGDRVVAPVVVTSVLHFGVLQRDPAGTWTFLGDSPDWEFPGAGADAALNEDGSLLLAQSGRNLGRVGELSADGRWRNLLAEVGTLDYGMQFTSFLDPAGAPALIGRRPVVERRGVSGWAQTGQLANYALEGDALVERPWDPAETAGLSDIAAASAPDGSSVLLGAQVSQGGEGMTVDLVGWFRPGAGGPPVAVEGLASPVVESLEAVTYADGTWIAVGSVRSSFASTDPHAAAVWTSTDGTTWSRADGLVAGTAPGAESWAFGACALPGGELLAVGEYSEGAQTRPVAWRSTGGQWQRLDGSAFAAEFGSLSSCATDEGATIVQGTSEDRATVWRTTDGGTFEPTTIGGRGETFGTIRVVDGGYAAAGTVSARGQQGAVVWLSADAESWRAVPVPSARVLSGADVMADGNGGLVVATTSGASPEVWVLANPGELFADA
ncbi:hypothetical protein [Blastococcus xanthinilyticus]|uniref:Uncharacterized protein n=1 Tax=Blastococcus xanthinilyticus TaxID=1564164 RepID=A0A5S5CQM5_9ACTN|nr:hypothetical protein [Blastococcus xanthinilyticus]TYP83832.1 hypothetical protein BD833_11572 [Blastococcus xanthinilyticus]